MDECMRLLFKNNLALKVLRLLSGKRMYVRQLHASLPGSVSFEDLIRTLRGLEACGYIKREKDYDEDVQRIVVYNIITGKGREVLEWFEKQQPRYEITQIHDIIEEPITGDFMVLTDAGVFTIDRGAAFYLAKLVFKHRKGPKKKEKTMEVTT